MKANPYSCGWLWPNTLGDLLQFLSSDSSVLHTSWSLGNKRRMGENQRDKRLAMWDGWSVARQIVKLYLML
jgi:hypothetical protein